MQTISPAFEDVLFEFRENCKTPNGKIEYTSSRVQRAFHKLVTKYGNETGSQVLAHLHLRVGQLGASLVTVREAFTPVKITPELLKKKSNGDHLTDRELLTLLGAYKAAADALIQLGDVFYLAFKEANSNWRDCVNYASARGIYDQYLIDLRNELPVSAR